MPSNNKRIEAISGPLVNVTTWVACVGLVLMTVVIAWQVIGRYALNDSPPWSEPLALIVMLYVVLLGAAVGVSEQFHLGVRVFVSLLPLRWRRVTYFIGQMLIAVFGATMAVNGQRLIEFTATHVVPAINISRSVTYWPFVISGVLITFFSLLRCTSAMRSDGAIDPWN